MDELFQNNHHARAASANFASRRFEFDPTWPFIWLLDGLGVIELTAAARGTSHYRERSGARRPSPAVPLGAFAVSGINTEQCGEVEVPAHLTRRLE